MILPIYIKDLQKKYNVRVNVNRQKPYPYIINILKNGSESSYIQLETLENKQSELENLIINFINS